MRAAATYRGARRNAAKGSVWRGIQGKYRPCEGHQPSERKRFLYRSGYPYAGAKRGGKS